MLYGIQVIVLFLIVKYISCVDTDSCKGDICRESLAMPLLDNLKAPLVVNLDITQFNKLLQGYINEQQGVDEAKKEMRGEMEKLVDTFEDDHVKAGFTACVGKGHESNITADYPIPFTTMRTSHNVDMSSVTKNGTFTFKRSNTDNGFFGIYDNSNVMVYGNTAEHQGTGYYHTGTVDVVKNVAYGNTIIIRPWKAMLIGE